MLGGVLPHSNSIFYRIFVDYTSDFRHFPKKSAFCIRRRVAERCFRAFAVGVCRFGRRLDLPSLCPAQGLTPALSPVAPAFKRFPAPIPRPLPRREDRSASAGWEIGGQNQTKGVGGRRQKQARQVALTQVEPAAEAQAPPGSANAGRAVPRPIQPRGCKGRSPFAKPKNLPLPAGKGSRWGAKKGEGRGDGRQKGKPPPPGGANAHRAGEAGASPRGHRNGRISRCRAEHPLSPKQANKIFLTFRQRYTMVTLLWYTTGCMILPSRRQTMPATLHR